MLASVTRRCLSMSGQLLKGHSKWQNIKETKGKNDMLKSKAINVLLKKAKSVLKKNNNFDLRLNRELAAVESEFKAQSLPLDSFKNFLQKMKEKPEVEMSFNVIGPSGSFFIIQTESESPKSMDSTLNKYLKKVGGFRLASDPSAVRSWFTETGVILVGDERNGQKISFEKMEEYGIEADCEHVQMIEEENKIKYELLCDMRNLSKVEAKLQSDGFNIESADVEFRPTHPVLLKADDATKVEKLYELFQNDDSIKQVFDNIQPGTEK